MTTPANENDPRVKRTRQLLLQAFISLLEERRNIYIARMVIYNTQWKPHGIWSSFP